MTTSPSPGAELPRSEDTDGKRISAQAHDLVTEMGRLDLGRAAYGQLKRDEFARLDNPVVLTVLRHVKQRPIHRGG